MELLEDLPQEILSWQLKGSGLENLGVKGRPDTVPFPKYTEDNLIARIDAVGLCFSDIKLLTSGQLAPAHRRAGPRQEPHRSGPRGRHDHRRGRGGLEG